MIQLIVVTRKFNMWVEQKNIAHFYDKIDTTRKQHNQCYNCHSAENIHYTSKIKRSCIAFGDCDIGFHCSITLVLDVFCTKCGRNLPISMSYTYDTKLGIEIKYCDSFVSRRGRGINNVEIITDESYSFNPTNPNFFNDAD